MPWERKTSKDHTCHPPRIHLFTRTKGRYSTWICPKCKRRWTVIGYIQGHNLGSTSNYQWSKGRIVQ